MTEEFPEFIGGDDEPITPIQIVMRKVLCYKEGKVAFLYLEYSDKMAAITRVDPRELAPTINFYNDIESAIDWWFKSLEITKSNGWIVYPVNPNHQPNYINN